MEYFGKPDNLSAFTNPDFGMKFKYMNKEQSQNTAKQVLNGVVESGYKNIVVIESGTAPLIEMIKKIEPKINFIQLKIPRSLDFPLLEWFRTYLTAEEFEKRKNRLEGLALENAIKPKEFTIYDSINDNFEYDMEKFEPFWEILKGTKLYEVFNSEFLVFDEYINAGTIIKNFQIMSKMFCPKPKFKLSAFCMFLKTPEKLKSVAFTLYDKSTELGCYLNGAYPFENRVDLIGYYYFINQNNFQKIHLKDLKREFSVSGEISLYEKIYQPELSLKLKELCQEEQVRYFVNEADIARYIIKILEEKAFGITKYSDFLDQVFEIYAPAWSPMPVKNHLDYWQAFAKLHSEIDLSQFLDIYKKERPFIFNDILTKLEKNHEDY